MIQTLGLALPNRDALLEAEARRAQIGDVGLRRDVQFGEDMANLRSQEALRAAQTLGQEPGLPTGMAIPTAQGAQPAPAAAPAAQPQAGLPSAAMPPAASAAAAQTDKMRGASRKAAKQKAEQAWPDLGTGADMLTYPFRLGAAVGARMFPGQSDEERRVAETRRSGVIEKTAADLQALDRQLTPEFFARQRQVESGGDPNAVSPKGAVGTMQTMPGTLRAPGFGVMPARDNSPAELQRVGEDYMRAMTRRYGDVATALVAYNWGPGNTDRWLAAGANPAQLPAETRGYLQKMLGSTQQAAAPAQPAAPAAGIPTQQAAASAAAPQFAPVAMPEGYMGLPPREMAVAQQRLQQIQAMFNATRDPAQRSALMGQYQQLQDSIYETQLATAAQRASAGDEQSLSSLAQAAQQYIVRTGDGRYALATQDRATGQFVPNPNQVGTAQEVAQYLLNQASTTRRAAAQALATKQQEELIKAQGAGARAAAELPAQIRLEQAKLNTAIQQELAKAEVMGRRPANVVALKDNIGNTTGAIIVYNDGSYKQVGGGEQTTDGGMRVVQ